MTPSTCDTNVDTSTVISVEVDHDDTLSHVSSMSCNSSIYDENHHDGIANDEHATGTGTATGTGGLVAVSSIGINSQSASDEAIEMNMAGTPVHAHHNEYQYHPTREDASTQHDELMHRSQPFEYSREDNVSIDAEDHTSATLSYNSTPTPPLNDDPTTPTTEMNTQLQIKDAIIHSQREELARYNNLINKYRNSIREKNLSLKSMEPIVDELKNEIPGITHNPTDENDDNLAIEVNQTFSSAFTSSMYSCEEATLEAMQSELRTYKQIIASLTDENNAFRQKDTVQLQAVDQLKQELHQVKQRVVEPEGELKLLREEVEMKAQMAQAIMKQMTTLQENDNGNQVQIAELGHEVIRLEKLSLELEQDNETLQKLLTTSREAVLNRSMMSGSVPPGLNDSGVGDAATDHVNTSINSSFRSMEEDGYTVVQESLRNELEATKKREQYLREQLEEMCHNANNDKDSIMEKVSESQQEAIIYLNGEVGDLRSQLEIERKKFDAQLDIMKITEEKIQVLEDENKLAVAETIKTEKLWKSVRQDLSMKAGENACLRDEIAELEEKASIVERLEVTLKQMEVEFEKLSKVNAELEAQAQARVVVPAQRSPFRPPKSVSRPRETDHDNMSEADETVMTVEIDNDKSFTFDAEAEILEKTRPSEQGATLRKFSVLKKALKQNYEQKRKELEQVLESKESQIGKLTVSVESQRLSQQKQRRELRQLETKRISHESEMNEELENLKTSLKDRDIKINALKVKMHRLQDKCKGEGTSWRGVSGISDALMDGVGASIKLFESMSFSNDEDEADKEEDRRDQRSATLSSKSFG